MHHWSKSNPVTGLGRPWGFQDVEAPSFQDNRHMKVCCILHGPGGKRFVDVVPGGTELDLRLRRLIGQVGQTRNNPRDKCNGVYWASRVNNAFTSALYWVQISGCLAPALTFNTHWSSSFIQSWWSLFEIFYRLQLAHKAATVTYITNSVNKQCELQIGEDSAQCIKRMTDIQYIPQSCRKKVYQPHSNNIHQIYNS